MLNRVSMGILQNEFLFKKIAISTCLGAICCKIECVLPLNGVRFGAKRSAFWCKMECVLVLNASHFGAKCGAICR